MNKTLILFGMAISFALVSCKETKKAGINGTWQLYSAKNITQGDTVTIFPVQGQEMIKIFNDTHFAFFRHDTNSGKDSTATFTGGGGTYSLSGTDYTEQLEYCNARSWEHNTFHFTLQRNGDTLIQKGIEKIDSLGVNREIIEIYVKESH